MGKGNGSRIKERIGFFKLVTIFLKSLFSAAINMPGIIKKRAVIQKRKVITYSDVSRFFKKLGVPFVASVYK